MKNFVLAVALLSLCCGCAKLAHLQELLTLKDLSEEGDRMDRFVEQGNKDFEVLAAHVKDGSIKQYVNQRGITRKFGQPVFARQVVRNDQRLQLWLYRYPVKFFNSDKVYLYFDDTDALVDWEFKPSPTKQPSGNNT